MRIIAPLALILIAAIVVVAIRYGAKVRKTRNIIRDLAATNPQALLAAISQDARIGRQIDPDVVQLLIKLTDRVSALEQTVDSYHQATGALLNEPGSYELGEHYTRLSRLNQVS